MAESIETTTRHSSHHVSSKGKEGDRKHKKRGRGIQKPKTKILTCVIVIYRVSPDRRKTHAKSFKQQLQLSRNPQEPPLWLYSGQHTANPPDTEQHVETATSLPTRQRCKQPTTLGRKPPTNLGSTPSMKRLADRELRRPNTGVWR